MKSLRDRCRGRKIGRVRGSGGRSLRSDHRLPYGPPPAAFAPLARLVAPLTLGLKNIKAITKIAYTAAEPRDYWAERGYSKYDGL